MAVSSRATSSGWKSRRLCDRGAYRSHTPQARMTPTAATNILARPDRITSGNTEGEAAADEARVRSARHQQSLGVDLAGGLDGLAIHLQVDVPGALDGFLTVVIGG